jgi:hypothetical protein
MTKVEQIQVQINELKHQLQQVEALLEDKYMELDLATEENK